MTSIHRHALVRHSALRMYTLVNDVAAYPERFAWCEDSEVIEASDTRMLARMDLTFAGLRTSFTTENTLSAPTRIELRLVHLRMHFEMAGLLIGSALAIGFQGLADRMVDDFCREADKP